MSEEIQGQGFTIKDHRHSQKTDEGIENKSLSSANSTSKQPESIQDFKIDFSTFILSLTSSAFYHLGEIPDPKTGAKKIDLNAVKQTIDIISMLSNKTEGNLSDEEKKLIEQLTYELQVKYIDAQSKKSTS
jgi:hypothetical protein